MVQKTAIRSFHQWQSVLGSKHLTRRRTDPHSQERVSLLQLQLLRYKVSCVVNGRCSCLLSPSSSSFFSASEPKLTIKAAVLERDENIMVVSSSDLNSPSLYSFLLQKSLYISFFVLLHKSGGYKCTWLLAHFSAQRKLGTSSASSVSCREGCYFEAEMLVGQQEIRRRLLWSGLGEGCWKSKCQNKRQKDGLQTSELV